MRKFAIAALASMTCLYTNARQLTVDEALSKARDCTGVSVLRTSRGAGSDLKLVHTESDKGLNTIYILNRENGGFVIMSADDAGAPVLGYSDTGYIDTDNMDSNFQYWLKGLSSDIASAIEAGALPYTTASDTEAPRYEPIAPMTVCWNQGYPYNKKLPKIGDRAVVTGCVATSQAQVMKYHNWPVHGKGTAQWDWSYTLNNQKYIEPQIMDFANTTFEWDKMLTTYSSSESAESEDAVATLMYAIGVADKMAWRTDGSGAVQKTAAIGLMNYFNYDVTINYVPRKYFTIDEWDKLIYDNFVNYGPVVLEGDNITIGHSYVTDGYQDGFFHINWGWGGMSNGYFKLDALNPSKQGIGGSVNGYTLSLKAVTGIRPPVDGAEPGVIVGAGGDFMTNVGTPVTVKTTFDRNIGYDEEIHFFDNTYNGRGCFIGLTPMVCQGGIKLVAEDNTVIYLWDNEGEKKKEYDHGFWKLPINVSAFPTSGTYTVTPVAKCNGVIHDIHVAPGKIRELTLKATESTLEFSSDYKAPEITITNTHVESDYYTGIKSPLSVELINTGGEYQGTIQPRFMDSDGKEILSMRQEPSFVCLRSGETRTYGWDLAFSSNITLGKYKVYFVDDKDKTIAGADPVEFTINDSQLIDLRITEINFEENSGTEKVPSQYGTGTATVVPRNVTIDLKIKSNYSFEQKLYIYVYSPKASNPLETISQPVSLSKDEINNVSISHKFGTKLIEGDFYWLNFYSAFPTNTGKKIQIKDQSGYSKSYYIRIDPNDGVELIEADNDVNILVSSTEISLKSNASLIGADIYSITGKKILSTSFAENTTSTAVDISDISSGVYLARITTANGTKVVKFVK